jgi:peptidoglycan/xylan/chitin deacetylase (PgdA/CDA1 family)
MTLKQSFLAYARRLGITTLVRDSDWRRQRLLILCYHGIAQLDEHEWNPNLYISPAFFRERMTLLRNGGYNVLRLEDGMRRLYAGTLPPKSVALTFDDGATDFATKALPILEEFQFPATVYLTTYYCDHRAPVFDTALSYILWRGRASGGNIASLIGSERRLGLESPAARAAAWTAVQAYAASQGLTAQAKDLLLRSVAEAVAFDYGDMRSRELLQIMSPDVVRALPRNLIDVQLHTHRHRTPRVRDLFLSEVQDNRSRMEALLGKEREYVHFCYPSGDYDAMFLEWLREADVRTATTCAPGLADRSSDPLLLPRFVDTTGQSSAVFEAWLSGFAALLPSSRRNRLDPARHQAI